MGKTRKAGLAAAFIILLFYANAMNAEAQPTLEAQFLYANAWTWTSDNSMARHSGFEANMNMRWLFFSKSVTNPSDAPVLPSLFFSAGIHLQFLDMGASNWLADGSRYRAWNALGMGPEAGMGMELPGILQGRRQTVFLAIAPIANFSKYTDTTLYNAYWSGFLRLSWEAEFANHWAVGISLPVEIAGRSDGTSVIAGIGVGLSYAF